MFALIAKSSNASDASRGQAVLIESPAVVPTTQSTFWGLSVRTRMIWSARPWLPPLRSCNLMTSVGNMGVGLRSSTAGPRRTSFVTCVITAQCYRLSGLAPLSVPRLVFACVRLGTCGRLYQLPAHAFDTWVDHRGPQRVNGLMVFYSNIAYTAGRCSGGAIVSCFATHQSSLSAHGGHDGCGGRAYLLGLSLSVFAPAKGRGRRRYPGSGGGRGARLVSRPRPASHLYLGFLVSFAFGASDSSWSRCSIAMYSTWISSKAGLAVLGRGLSFSSVARSS